MKKKCFKCGLEKNIDDFYEHKAMADGRLGKCKACTKDDVAKRTNEKKQDPEWLEKERERCREKNKRLGFYEKSKKKYHTDLEYKLSVLASKKKHQDKYPEKKTAKNKSRRIGKPPWADHNHHWSYRDEHQKDVIPLTTYQHGAVHRHTVYDPERMQYRRTDNGLLLDSKSDYLKYMIWVLHKDWLGSLRIDDLDMGNR